jgi:hypothetical protein
MGSSLKPSASNAKRKRLGSTEKPGRPSEVLIATSQIVARLNAMGLSRERSSLPARGERRSGSNADHRTRWVSSNHIDDDAGWKGQRQPSNMA